MEGSEGFRECCKHKGEKGVHWWDSENPNASRKRNKELRGHKGTKEVPDDAVGSEGEHGGRKKEDRVGFRWS